MILDSLDRTPQQNLQDTNYNDFNQNNQVNNSFRIYNSNPNLRSREIYESRQELVNPQIPIDQPYHPSQQHPTQQYQQPQIQSTILTKRY